MIRSYLKYFFLKYDGLKEPTLAPKVQNIIGQVLSVASISKHCRADFKLVTVQQNFVPKGTIKIKLYD